MFCLWLLLASHYWLAGLASWTLCLLLWPSGRARSVSGGRWAQTGNASSTIFDRDGCVDVQRWFAGNLVWTFMWTVVSRLAFRNDDAIAWPVAANCIYSWTTNCSVVSYSSINYFPRRGDCIWSLSSPETRIHGSDRSTAPRITDTIFKCRGFVNQVKLAAVFSKICIKRWSFPYVVRWWHRKWLVKRGTTLLASSL